MKREDFIKGVAEGKIRDEEIISYCKQNILDKDGLQGLMMDMWIADTNHRYYDSRLLNKALDVIIDYFGVWMCDGEENIIIERHKDTLPIYEANNVDDVLKQVSLDYRFEKIVKDRSQTAIELDNLLQMALDIPVVDGLILHPQKIAIGIEDALKYWLISKEGVRIMRAESLKRLELSNLDEGVKRLSNSIEERAREWVYNVCQETEHQQELLPDGLNTQFAEDCFKKALSYGWMEKTDTGFKWKRTKAQLAYFCERVFCHNNMDRFPETALNELFGVTRLWSALEKLKYAKKDQIWKVEIDNIFK